MGAHAHRAAGLLWQAAVVVGLALVAVVVVDRGGSELPHDLRETLLRLTPERGVAVAAALAATLVAWSLGAGRRATSSRAAATTSALPVVALLGAVVTAAATFRLLLGRTATEPRVLGDELVYSGLAKGFALHGEPVLRGAVELSQSLLYPLAISPAYLLAGDGARAFEAVKAIDALAMTSTAVPAYLLTRRVARQGPSLVVAALVAFQPWTMYASLVMTEALFLPVATTFVLLLARMLERPTAGRQLSVLVALGLLVAIRPQALVFAPATIAVAALGVDWEPLARRLRTYAPLLAGLALGALAAALATVVGPGAPGTSAVDVLRSLGDPVGLAKWSLWTLGVYELALGVLALAVFPLALYRLVRSPVARLRATGLALLAAAGGLVLSTAVVSASPAGLGVLHERYLFSLAPLVLAGLAYWLDSGMGPSRAGVLAVAIGAVALAATVPAGRLASANNVDSPTAVWVAGLHAELADIPLRAFPVLLALLGAVALVLARGRVAPFVTVAVAFALLTSGTDYSGPFTREQDRQLAWVDHALPSDATASLVHLGYSRPDQPCAEGADYEQQGLVVLTEFFNTRVARVYHVAEQVGRDNLGSPALTIGPGGVVLEGRQPFAPGYAILDSRQPVVGTRLGRLDLARLGSQYQDGASLTLWRVDPPLRFLPHAQPLPPRPDGREC